MEYLRTNMFIKRGVEKIISIIDNEESLEEVEPVLSRDASKQVRAQLKKDKTIKTDKKLES